MFREFMGSAFHNYINRDSRLCIERKCSESFCQKRENVKNMLLISYTFKQVKIIKQYGCIVLYTLLRAYAFTKTNKHTL